MSQGVETSEKKWTREEVEETLKGILMDALGVDEDKVVPDASLVHDLGAESIDFLDIGFRFQQTFGVELPNKVFQDKIVNWRNLGELRGILEERYGARIAPEEIRQLHTRGIPEVLQWLAGKQGIRIENGDSEKIAGELADRLAHELESFGFRASLLDREGIIQDLLQNLNSPKIMEGMLRAFSVGAMVDYITERVGEKR